MTFKNGLWLILASITISSSLWGQVVFQDSFEDFKFWQPLNDTGITLGGEYPEGNNATCTGETITAQDCLHGRDVTHNDNSDGHAGFSFTKLDANGNDLPASAEEWSCARDNVTGLVWEVKTDDGGLHDTDNTYTWYNPDSATNGGGAGTANGGVCTGSDCDTTSYVEAVNTLPNALCGYSDWRMPWQQELMSIVNFELPAIETSYFPRERKSIIWSGSSEAKFSNSAWYINFASGDDGTSRRNNSRRVRLVRGGQSFMSSNETPARCRGDILPSTPSSAFTVHGNGTVTDLRTGLRWKQCLEGQSGPGCESGWPTQFNWQQALQHADAHSFATYDDWRLPNIKELVSIVEKRCYDPAINLAIFPNEMSSSVWSSSPSFSSPADAWLVTFNLGDHFGSFRTDDVSNRRVRLVRGGQ